MKRGNRWLKNHYALSAFAAWTRDGGVEGSNWIWNAELYSLSVRMGARQPSSLDSNEEKLQPNCLSLCENEAPPQEEALLNRLFTLAMEANEKKDFICFVMTECGDKVSFLLLHNRKLNCRRSERRWRISEDSCIFYAFNSLHSIRFSVSF